MVHSYSGSIRLVFTNAMRETNWFIEIAEWFTLHPFSFICFLVLVAGSCYAISSKIIIERFYEK
jgi:hypothetical protein